MRRLFEQIERVAASSANVLVIGETGTGKELVAGAIHRASRRDPFVPINAAAIPADLLESELFGHAKGAFTGAAQAKPGLFEVAHGGTLFLDEIGEMPTQLQAKLLRVLQSGELRRVGEVENRSVDVRVIAATHHDLRTSIAARRFREDLFFRLNVVPIEVPPLRERPTDIPLLAERFLAQLCQREGWPEKRISAAALAALVEYSWPGNVRELLNVVQHSAIFAEKGEIRPEDLPEAVYRRLEPPEEVSDAAERQLSLAELEREYVLELLRRVGGNKKRAAELLQVPRRTLYRMLASYSRTPPAR
jgi:two-component system response regulator PilR (NtrC family)